MTTEPKEKIGVTDQEEPIYGGDVISGVKSLFPGLVEEHHARTEELRVKRENELSALGKDERYSEEYTKMESEKIKSGFNSLFEAEEAKHLAQIQNSLRELRAEEQSVIYADDEEEGAYQKLLKEAKTSIRDAVLTDDKVSRKLALETAMNLRKIAQIEEQRELTKQIRHYPLEALETYKTALAENNTRLINYFESVWPTVKVKTNPLAVGDMEKDSASMQVIESDFTKLRDARLKKLSDRLGPVTQKKNALQLYLNNLELARSMRR
ncbi:MAG: hypothetical protein IIA58_01500 [Candidatus Marinimicrobia bacterium]|nr:hypothetical protein [Candidatus Neomarinimicrobiota bacterium]